MAVIIIIGQIGNKEDMDIMENVQNKNMLYIALTDRNFYLYCTVLLAMPFLPFVLPESIGMNWPFVVLIAISNLITVYPWGYVISPNSTSTLMTFLLMPVLIFLTGILFSGVSLRIGKTWAKWLFRNIVIWIICWLIISWTVSIIAVNLTGATYDVP